MEPKKLLKKNDRQMARRMRDEQWEFMRKVARFGTVWFCPWDKYRRHENPAPAEDEDIHGLIGGMERLEWLGAHRSWWIIGKWNEVRCARPIRLTKAGRAALKNWKRYDMEPVTGGMVEPGWQATPLPRKAVA